MPYKRTTYTSADTTGATDDAIELSVVVPAFSDLKTMSHFLQALSCAQVSNHKLELVIVDDCSPCDLHDVLKTNLIPLKKIFARIVYILNDRNSGRAITRNNGAKEALGKIVLFLDCDGMIAPDYFTRLLSLFSQSSSIAIRGNRRVHQDIKEKSAYLRYFDSRFIGARLSEVASKYNLTDLPAKFFATGEIAIPRQHLLQVGFFNENFSAYGCEDEELGWRLQKSGVRLQFQPDLHITDIDDCASIRRATDRMTTYAQHSFPILLKEHPEAISSSHLPGVENFFASSPTPSAVRLAILTLLYTTRNIGVWLLSILDGKRINQAAAASGYKLVLGLSYLIGVLKRSHDQIELK